ncbi:hypothetical protein GHL01_00305 [Sinorhizobium meliloti]|uniref:hypothetical protein n=1 Tax=Rhizobium meliloti TaxID=382 RepID=UPI0012978A78|nr:hypothetical protein [Sinorhizobium meliloti]MQV12186.1 hypothetical protein [Sinorhizobium meliloti]
MITWFLASTVGKTVLKWSGIAALLATAYWRIYASGKAAAEAERVTDDLNAIKDKEHLNDKVRKMDSSGLDRELSRWVRD